MTTVLQQRHIDAPFQFARCTQGSAGAALQAIAELQRIDAQAGGALRAGQQQARAGGGAEQGQPPGPELQVETAQLISDLLEPLLLVGVDVGMQFAGQPSVGALDLRVTCPLAHSEQAVVVACHAEPSVTGAGCQPARLPSTSPMYIATAATFAIVPG